MLLGNEVQRAGSQTGQTGAGILGQTPQEQGSGTDSYVLCGIKKVLDFLNTAETSLNQQSFGNISLHKIMGKNYFSSLRIFL